MMRRLESVSDGLNRTLRPASGGAPTVRWMERTPRGQHVSLSAVPLDLAPVLRELLFDRLRTVVLTSATLAAAGEFTFLESRLGLGGESSPVTVREIFSSPFDYPSQCLFGVPNDLPEPREDEPAHGAAVVQVVTDLAYASDGGMFVLFTSHAALQTGGAGASNRPGRPLADPGAGRVIPGYPAPPFPRAGERDPAGHRLVLGGRRRARAVRSAPWF